MGIKATKVKDSLLKARRTSLDKKSKEELINIILRKDSTERKNNSKIEELNKTILDKNLQYDKLLKEVEGTEKKLTVSEDNRNTLLERIDNLNEELMSKDNNIYGLQNMIHIFKNAAAVQFIIILILVIILWFLL